MNHKRTWLAGMACLLGMMATAQAKALMIAPPPTGMRIANADLIVAGKVTGYGAKMIKAEMFKGDTREMQVATVKVADVLMGGEVKEVKVGFFPPMNNTGGPRIGGGRQGVVLKQSEEYALILMKHPTHKDVYVAQNFYDAIVKKDNANYAKEVEAIKKSAKLLAKPIDGLKSKEAADRLTTAALLITRYRTARTGTEKTEQVSAEESKLILEALAEADWKPKGRFGGETSPMNLFFTLGVTDKDGWKQPKDFNKVGEEAQKWCKDNAAKYRINRLVPEKKDEKKEDKK